MNKKDKNEYWRDFESAAKRSLRERLKYSFIWTYKPGLDDPPHFRSFKTMQEYRQWTAKNLPSWLGYGKKI